MKLKIKPPCMYLSLFSMHVSCHSNCVFVVSDTAVDAWLLTPSRSLHGHWKQLKWLREDVLNLSTFLFCAAWILTLCVHLFDHTPHCTQQLDQNQPEKLLEDQKRVGTHCSMSAQLTTPLVSRPKVKDQVSHSFACYKYIGLLQFPTMIIWIGAMIMSWSSLA